MTFVDYTDDDSYDDCNRNRRNLDLKTTTYLYCVV